MIESLEQYSENNSDHYCSECGRNIPSEFIPEHKETPMCVYCFRHYRPQY